METIYISELKPEDFLINVGLVSAVTEYLNCFVVQFKYSYGNLSNMVYNKGTLVTIRKRK